MDDYEKIRVLLTSAGMLMEDVCPRLLVDPDDIPAVIKLLRDTAHDLKFIADMIEVIERNKQLPR